MDFKRSAGIIAHPTMFPSPYGIGDLGPTAYNFIDFIYESNLSLWQILPLGPTSFGDSPYQSFSTFAGHPLLISPELLIKDKLLTNSDIENPPPFDTCKVDYGKVIIYKNTLFKKAFQNSKEIFTQDDIKNFKSFCKQNNFWLDDFAMFLSIKQYFIEKRCSTYESKEYLQYYKINIEYMKLNALKDDFYGAVWNSWPDDIKNHTPEAIKLWSEKLFDDIEYYKFLQYIFFKQWLAVKKYANEKHIKIIGDIPIFVAMDSADVWANRPLFCIDEKGHPSIVAGVPPDYFSSTGQLWGNPLYQWSKHKSQDYKWWCDRITHALSMTDILRIDHFRGFNDYWAIPYGEDTAINGKWLPGPGKDFFVEIKQKLGYLPIIAEDLGIITEDVTKLRTDLGFPGMLVLQFAFESNNKNTYLPHNIKDPNTVIYTGTHDNDTTTGWYINVTDSTKDHVRRYLNVSGEDIAWDMIRVAFNCVATFAIIPIQDILSLGSFARMNTPGVAFGNWQFRYEENVLWADLSSGLAYLANLYNREASCDNELEEH